MSNLRYFMAKTAPVAPRAEGPNGDVKGYPHGVDIRVRPDAKGFVLIEGYHRLEALRALGETVVDAFLVHARLH